jgi:exonuclease SbcC
MSAAIALQMAMVNEFSDSRFCIFDEPTAHLDEDRCENLADAIRRIRTDLGFTQLLLVSHDDTFGTDVEHVVEFEKVGGGTAVKDRELA